MDVLTPLAWLSLLMLLAVFAGIAVRSLSTSTQTGMRVTLGALVQLLIGLTVTALITYVVMYFLSLIGGFYESLTCKVVTIPACEDPLGLPAWLRLPAQSVGGVMGVLPLLAVFLAKTLQARHAPLQLTDDMRWYQRAGTQLWHWLGNNFGIVLILIIELWLAALRGGAEAADRQVRIALGLDQDLPAAYLSIAQWGAVVLALGLSALVIYLGMLARYSRLLIVDAFTRLEYGAGLVSLTAGLIKMLANTLVVLWTVTAVAVGRLALKLQSAAQRLWAAALIAIGRFALKVQSFTYRSWVFFATTVGWTVLGVRNLFKRDAPRRPLEVLVAAALTVASVSGLAQANTFVVLFDATGSEAGRLGETQQTVLSWADPSPQRALLSRGDRLIVIPIRAPGQLDLNYSALFNATYPSNQLDRYAFYTDLRAALPQQVDSEPGTDVSASLRAAELYLQDVTDKKILIVFGNGEDHNPDPIQASELSDALADATVIHLNMGLEQRDKWRDLYETAGASTIRLFDLAATRSLRQEDLQESLNASP